MNTFQQLAVGEIKGADPDLVAMVAKALEDKSVPHAKAELLKTCGHNKIVPKLARLRVEYDFRLVKTAINHNPSCREIHVAIVGQEKNSNY